MRKGIISLLLFFASYIHAGAQGIVDSGSFNEVVDYLNCKLVDFSIESSKDEKATEIFRSNCNCDSKPNSATIQKAIPIKLKKTHDLSKEINSIKNKFKPNWKVEDATLYLKDTIFLNGDNLRKFSENHQTEDPFLAIKNSIADRLNRLIKNTSIVQAVQAVESPTDPPPPEKPTILSQFTLPVILLCVIVLLLFVWILVITKKMKSHEIPEHVEAFVMSRISKSNQHNNNSNNRKTASSYDNSSSTSHNKEVNEQIKELNERINRLQAEIATNLKIVNRSSNTTGTDNSNSIQETFYLSTPNTDGSFDNNDISQFYREGASIYRFVKSSNNRATFVIEDKEDSIRRALQYPDKRIDPVCEAMNAFNQNAKSIKTISPGEVELIGDKWIISYNRKAKIRYE